LVAATLSMKACGWSVNTTWMLAWQPGGTLLAIGACSAHTGKAWIAEPHHKPIVVTQNGSLLATEPWSPDGRVLLVESGGGVRASAHPR